jgi:two-component system KDP operon response regulator KdpE
VHLTSTEHRLLAYLLQHAGQVLSFDQLLTAGWGPAYSDAVNYLHVYIHRLRSKLEQHPNDPIYLLTERGVGYRFEMQRPDRGSRAVQAPR